VAFLLAPSRRIPYTGASHCPRSYALSKPSGTEKNVKAIGCKEAPPKPYCEQAGTGPEGGGVSVRRPFRHSHGGTGRGSAHKSGIASHAVFFNSSRRASPSAYVRDHSKQPGAGHYGTIAPQPPIERRTNSCGMGQKRITAFQQALPQPPV
jgi:hypothetical protein